MIPETVYVLNGAEDNPIAPKGNSNYFLPDNQAINWSSILNLF